MYKTALEKILIKALKKIQFKNKFRSEDDARQAYAHAIEKLGISIDIPSTRNSGGDISFSYLKKNLELKYCSAKPKIEMKEIHADFQLLLQEKTHFFVIIFDVNLSHQLNKYIAEFINFGDINKLFNISELTSINSNVIKFYLNSIFLGFVYPHHPVERKLSSSSTKGKKGYAIFTFEKKQNICRKYLLKISSDIYIGASVVGSVEDNRISVIFSKCTYNVEIDKNNHKEIKIKDLSGNDHRIATQYIAYFSPMREQTSLKNYDSMKKEKEEITVFEIF